MVETHYHIDPTPLFRRPKCTANIQLLCTSTYTLVIIQFTCRVLKYDCGEHLTCRSMLLLSRPTATKRKVSKVSEGCTQMCSIWLKWAKNEFLTIKYKLIDFQRSSQKIVPNSSISSEIRWENVSQINFLRDL